MNLPPLLLVDFDNIVDLLPRRVPLPHTLPDGSYAWLDGDTDRPSTCAAARDDPQAVVVLAMNLTTARDSRLTFDYLTRFAGSLAEHLLGASTFGLELGLTLVVPQAVDRLLERLLEQAPRREHATKLDRIELVSGDRGLSESIGARLGKRWTYHSDNRLWHRWTCERSSLRRKFQGLNVVGPTMPPDAIENIAIDRAELVAWASEQPLDFAAGLEFHELPDRITAGIGALSQIGATVKTVRGIDRLVELSGTERVRVGGCTERDGLELRSRNPAIERATRVEVSSLGPGAAWLPEAPGSVSSPAPWVAVQAAVAASGSVPVHKGQITVPNVLARLPPGPLEDEQGKRLRVSMLRRGDDLLVATRYTFGRPVERYWLIEGSAKAELRLPKLGYLLGRRTEFPGLDCRLEVTEDRDALVFAAAVPSTVIVEEPVPPHHLAMGRIDEACAAVLAGSHPLRAGACPVEPIQAISRARFRRSHPALGDHWEVLQRLPLVVPTKIS